MHCWRITIGTAVFLGFVLAVTASRWLFSPFPNEQHLIKLYATHERDFATLTKMIDSHCAGQLTPAATAVASRINPRMHVVCDYDGTVRFILGVRGLMTIGPERIIGLTYIPGNPARKGNIVPALGPYMQDVGNVYLRQINNQWYVFIQNTN